MKFNKGYLYLFGAFTLAGTSVVSARLLSGKLGVFTITAISLFIALFVLLPLCRKNILKIVRSMDKYGWMLTGLQAVFGIFLFRLFLLMGVARTSAGEAGIMTGATPAVTAILAFAILKEKLRFKNFAGIAFTVSGIFLIQGVLTQSYKPEHFLGNMLVLGAAASESLFNIFSRITALKSSKSKFDPIVQTTLVSIIAMILCIVLSTFEDPIDAVKNLGVTEWLTLLWYGWFVTVAAFIFWFSGIKRCPAYAAAAFSGMMPLTSLILSVTLLGESAGWHQWIGAALVIAGMVLIGLSRKKELQPAE